MRIALNMPVQAFLGVSIRLTPETDDTAAGVAVYLEHRDPALSIELYAAENADDVVAEWQLWSRVLGVPALVAGAMANSASPSRGSAASSARCRRSAAAAVRRSPGAARVS